MESITVSNEAAAVLLIGLECDEPIEAAVTLDEILDTYLIGYLRQIIDPEQLRHFKTYRQRVELFVNFHDGLRGNNGFESKPLLWRVIRETPKPPGIIPLWKVRELYPAEYKDLSDSEVARRVYDKFYAKDVPAEIFQRLFFTPKPGVPEGFEVENTGKGDDTVKSEK